MHKPNNDALMQGLNNWARTEAQIDPDVFKCRYIDSCNKSANNKLGTSAGHACCQMSYIGRRYGVKMVGETDEAFRLVLVGIDHGEPKAWNYEQCRVSMEEWYQIGASKFNQHYQGVVKTAAAVFGSAGDYCWQMCTTSCQKSRDPAAPGCVIDRIAQPNSVKCTSKCTVNRTSITTRTMMTNCAHHLVNELKLLKPGLVVFHGVKARDHILPEFATREMDLEAVSTVEDRWGPVLYESHALGSHVLFLYHPSRGFLNRQWELVVVPALNYLRHRNLIPT